jgi:hypothetical protein
LGEWYWNGGVQKSKASFKDLLAVIGDENFQVEDIRDTNWSAADQKLGSNDFDENAEVWLDEEGTWRCTPISISIPFHSRSQDPGPEDHIPTQLHHRSLVSVIKEKVTDPVHASLFHYEPYELLWHPPHKDHEVRVHGELYTSPAFLKANRELQELPGEPGCDLPRVVAGLMFSSDATHLTSFGDQKLWPLYVYFGNESKYRRCQPSAHTCTHVAYFQYVSART